MPLASTVAALIYLNYIGFYVFDNDIIMMNYNNYFVIGFGYRSAWDAPIPIRNHDDVPWYHRIIYLYRFLGR